jgi:hypothetical protein
MQTTDSHAASLETEPESIFFLHSPFRSRWFFLRTLEFLLVLGTDIFVLIKYWSRLTEHAANLLIIVVGVLMLVFPYRSIVQTCSELQELCRRAEMWDSEHRALLIAIVNSAQRSMGSGISRYFTTVWMLLVFVTYCLIRKP